jgi:hypothetical protein
MHERVRRLQPTARPPVALRVFVGIIGVTTAVAAVAILLSDRAPGVLTAMFGDVVVQISDRVDAAERADSALGERVPGNDAIVHIGIWAIIAALAGIALWTWLGLVASSAILGIGSLAVEVAQGRYSDTRVVERSDALANLVGIAIATAACAMLYVTWSGVVSLVGAHRRRRNRVQRPA